PWPLPGQAPSPWREPNGEPATRLRHGCAGTETNLGTNAPDGRATAPIVARDTEATPPIVATDAAHTAPARDANARASARTAQARGQPARTPAPHVRARIA